MNAKEQSIKFTVDTSHPGVPAAAVIAQLGGIYNYTSKPIGDNCVIVKGYFDVEEIKKVWKDLGITAFIATDD